MVRYYDVYVNQLRDRIREQTFPDLITIQRPTGQPTVTPSGILTWASQSLVSFEGSTLIPCRFDISRSFRPEKLPAQEINANEHNLHMPVGVDLRPNDIIRLVKQVPVIVDQRFTETFPGVWQVALDVDDDNAVIVPKLPGVRIDVLTEESRMFQTSGFTAERMGRVEFVAEVVSGTLTVTTPVGVFSQAAPFYGRGIISGTVDELEDDFNVTFSGGVSGVLAHVGLVEAYQYDTHRIFECRKVTDVSVFDVTTEALVTELEFQSTDNAS